ncbi:MAG: carboxypeptidase-like regulatory domain-containing protein [Planctomycetes bacterium]|nr:carboxypeptidase-like regulatory domain-containing protein [Planctomycetota bacterium]
MRRLACALLLVAIAIIAVLLSRASTARSARSDAPAAESPTVPSAPRPAGETGPQVDAQTGAADAAPMVASPSTVPPDGDASLVVLVVDEKRRPRLGVTLQVTYIGGGELKPGPQADTDEDGSARLAVLPVTRAYQAYVTARVGAYSRSAWFAAEEDEETRTTIVVPTGGRIAGVVRHATKGLLADVRVTGRPDEEARLEFLDARTDAEGRFLLDPVPPGSWKISIGGKDVICLKDYISVKLGQGGSADVGVIEVGGATINGLVRDAATGRPLAGVTVEIRDPVFFWPTTTDLRGRFRFEDLTPCLYAISFHRSDYARRYLAGVEVAAGNPTELTVDLAPAAVLHMEARDAGGRPYVGMAQFNYASPDGSGNFGVFFDEEGHARLQGGLPPGRYQLTLSAPGIDAAMASGEMVRGENKVQFAIVRRPVAPPDGVRSLHGTVRDAKTQAPLPGVRVCAQRLEANTDEHGQYVFANLESGECRVSAAREGYGDRHLEQVTIAEGEERLLDFTLEPAATVHVVFRDRGGNPIPGEALATFVRLADRVPTVLRLSADTLGRATVRRLAPGVHRVRCSMPGIGESERKEVTIPPGESEIEILLR